MIAAIARNTEEQAVRKEQIEDTRRLLSSLKTGEIISDDLISEFTRKYSLIATERILNYHFDECINSFIIENQLINPCIIQESTNIIKTFKSRFGNYKNTVDKLIKRINWNLNEFKELGQFEQLGDEIKTYLKPTAKKIIGKKIETSIKTFGINFTDNCYKKIISDEEYHELFQEQCNTFISKNILKINDIKDFSISDASNVEELMGNVINSIKNGLLNIGNSTEDIIFMMKDLIPIIRSIDKSGFVLDSFFKEMKSYFKQFRKDLNLALLNFLLKNKYQDFSLIEPGKANCNPLEYPPNVSSWKPDPIYIKSYINPEIKTADPINLIISQLSSNSFTSLAENYQKQLAERLLKVETERDLDEVIGEVELLKSKCGESFVTSLNIMINDVMESRNKITHDSSLKVTMISHRYWPEITSEKDELEHPESIARHLTIIKETFSRQYEDKKIIWRPQMDEVKVSLEFQNGHFLFTCPIEAAILLNSFDFSEEEEDQEFDLNMAAALTGISDRKVLKSAIIFWLKKRILIPSTTTPYHFKFAQIYDPNESDCVDAHLTDFSSKDSESFADDDEGSLDDSFTAFQEKYWPIISNMFKTFGQISAERIQSTLKMYSKEYKETLEFLTKFLQTRVRDGILQSNGNRIILYSLVNK